MLRYSLRQLEYLVACVDHGSLAAAAQKLNVSQPSISIAIAKLEHEFGVQLLLRHHAKGVTPTAAAHRLLQSARNVLSHANELQRVAHSSGSTLEGTLNLGGFATIAPMYLPRLIAELREKHPGLNLHIREGTQDELIERLRNGTDEAALVYELDLPPDLHTVSLLELHPHVLLPTDHPLAKGAKLSLRQLAGEPLILLDVPPSREYFTGMLRALELNPTIAHTSSSLELVRGMVGQGLGISILVTRPMGDLTYDGKPLATLPISDSVTTSNIVLATLKELRPTQMMLAFEKFAQQHFSNLKSMTR